MTTAPQLYVLPNDLKTLTSDGYDAAPTFDPALIVIDTETYGGLKVRYIRPYRWCYLDRLSLDETVISSKERKKVNLSSLCPRRVEIVRKLITSTLNGSINQDITSRMSTTFDWIDQQGRGGELFSLESAKGLYRDYTEQLRHRMQLSNVGFKKKGTIGYKLANDYQLCMALICAAAIGFKSSTVRNWAYRIPQRGNGPSRRTPAPKVTETEHAVAHALHTRFFTAFSDAILRNTPPPVVVELSDIGFEDIIFYQENNNSANGWVRGRKGLRTDWMPYFYGREGVFQGNLKAFDEFLAANGIESFGTESTPYRRLQRHAKEFSDLTRKYMANVATRHFGYLLIAEAGTNASTLATVDCSRTQLEKVLGASRLLAVKGRAGYEQQDQYVDRRFTQTTWKRYLDLRDWMKQRLGEKGHEAPRNGLFLLRMKCGKEPYYALGAHNMMQCSLWPNNGPALATREARKHKTVNILESSGGNVALASAMQVASTQTIQRHYSYKNVIEAAKQMSDYFEMQAKSAALRQAGVETFRIIEIGEDTSTGRCDVPAVEGPQLIEGFEDIGIEPRCGAPLTCLFCIHFGVHAIEEDLVRLLTIKRWVEVQTQLYASNIDDIFAKYGPYIQRIDQVFEELPKSSEVLFELVRRVKKRFAEGKRDPYWFAKTKALLDLETV